MVASTFTDTQVGTQSAAQTLTLTNGTSGPITIGTLGIAGQYLAFNDRCTGQTIAAGGACTLGAIFAPTAVGPQDGTVTIPVGTSTYVVNLYGVGVTTIATLDQFQLDFGDVLVGVESAPRTVTVTNRNAGPLTLGPVTSPDARFVVQEVADRPAPRRADHRIVFQHARQCDHLGVREFAPEVSDRRDAIHSPASADPSSPQRAAMRAPGAAPPRHRHPHRPPRSPGRAPGTSVSPDVRRCGRPPARP